MPKLLFCIMRLKNIILLLLHLPGSNELRLRSGCLVQQPPLMFNHVKKYRSFGVHKVEFNRQGAVHWALFSSFKTGPWSGLLRRKAYIPCDCYVIFWENYKSLLITLLSLISCEFVATVAFYRAFLSFKLETKLRWSCLIWHWHIR